MIIFLMYNILYKFWLNVDTLLAPLSQFAHLDFDTFLASGLVFFWMIDFLMLFGLYFYKLVIEHYCTI